MFSLEPVIQSDSDVKCASDEARKAMRQRKKFEPEWLAGTSAGDVMFQADYLLKELSMGEYEQPVVGMKNILDYSEAGAGDEWRSRAWFVVNRAEIQMTDGSVLVPRVDMGVEAREQVRGSDGMEDARITRPDHPTVQYAERFTHNFDLIAERKSVIYQLRELAKASVVAKFLQDNQTRLDDAWFTQNGAVDGVCNAESIPQLWNERRYAKIRVEGGKIVDSKEEEIHSDVRGVYGGIEFGLEKPQVSTGLKTYLGPSGPRVRPARLSILQPLMRPAAAARPQGVDLNLDDFDLSAAPTAADAREMAGSWGGSPVVGGAFWKMLGDGSGAALKDEDQRLLKAVFNPHMSDRREEGDMFLPPDSHADYTQKLRKLVGEEQGVREQRTSHFLGKAFEKESPGALFPTSWASHQGIARGQGKQDRAEAAARDGWVPTESQALRLQQTLKTTTPSFDKCAEEGMRFRIYQVGSLEVRTTKEHDGKEVIGVVFSAASRRHAHTGSKERIIKETDTVVKVSQYVEDLRPSAGVGKPQPGSEQHEHCRYFVALETEAGDVVVTEKLRDGMVTWAESPPDFDTRSSLAKVFSCADCPGAGVTIRDIKGVRAAEVSWKRPNASANVISRRYAQAIMEGVGALTLPATSKYWSALTVSQRHAAERLGIQGARGWDEGASDAWRATWQDLAESQRSAAEALDLNEATWEEMGRDWTRKQEHSWSQLAAAEREAAGQFGVVDAATWATQRGPLWAMAWAKLADQRAACPAEGR